MPTHGGGQGFRGDIIGVTVATLHPPDNGIQTKVLLGQVVNDVPFKVQRGRSDPRCCRSAREDLEVGAARTMAR
jgi:hypothetical protein